MSRLIDTDTVVNDALSDAMSAASLYARVYELQELAKYINDRANMLKQKADSLLYNGKTDLEEMSK